MNKCLNCKSCLKTLQVSNEQYKYCSLCLKVWSLPKMIELYDGELIDNTDIKAIVKEIVKKEPL